MSFRASQANHSRKINEETIIPHIIILPLRMTLINSSSISEF